MNTPHAHTAASPASLPCLEVLESRLAPAGLVTVTFSPGGALSLTGDEAPNQIEIAGHDNGSWTLRAGPDSGTLFRYQGNDVAEITFSKPLANVKASLGEGADSFVMQNLQVAGAVTVLDTAAAAGDTVSISGSTILGAVRIETGGGDDDVSLQSNNLRQTLTIKSGGDHDSIDLGAGIYKNVLVDLGSNAGTDDTFNFASTSAITVQGSIHVKTAQDGANHLVFSAPQFSVSGSLTLQASAHSTSVQLLGTDGGGKMTIGQHFLYQGAHGTQSEGYLGMAGNISIGGRADIRTGTDLSGFQLDAQMKHLKIGSLQITSPATTTDIRIWAEAISLGSASLRSSGGDFTCEIEAQQALNIRGDLALKSTSIGSPSLRLTSAGFLDIGGKLTVTTTRAENTGLYINAAGSIGSLTYQGGQGSANIFISGWEEGLTIHGRTHIAMGGGPSHQASFSQVSFSGALSLTSTTYRPAGGAPVSEGLSEDINFEASTFHGAVSLVSRNIADTSVAIFGSTFYSKLTLDTGLGDDNVIFGTSLLSPPPDLPNTFLGPVRVLLGGGTDTLVAANPLNGLPGNNRFHDTFHADGGAQSDIAELPASLTGIFATAPVLRSFDP